MIKSEINKLDKIWSLAVKKLAKNKCQKCGARSPLNSAHIFSRTYQSTRWSLQNGVCLCVGCHFWGHKDPINFAAFCIKLKGQKTIDELNILRQKKVKLFYDEVKESLEKKQNTKNNA